MGSPPRRECVRGSHLRVRLVPDTESRSLARTCRASGASPMTLRQRLEDALEAELSKPLPRQYGPWACRCGCKETRSAFSVALEFAQLGQSARSAVENVALHYDLSEAEQESLVEAIEEDLYRSDWRSAR